MKVFITQCDVPPPLPAAFMTGIVAQPGGQSDATLLTARSNNVTVVASNTGVLLNAGILGGWQRIYNSGTNPLLVYPPLGTQIQGYGSNVAAQIVVGGNAGFQFDGVITWLVS
jgi:hypothetical protein